MKLTLGEIFQKLEGTKSKKEKIEILKKNDSKHLRDILRINFNPKIEFLLPGGPIPYKPNKTAKPGMSETSLINEMKRMYLFLKGGHQALKDMRRQTLFLQMMESLDALDAELMLRLRDKKLKGVTKLLAEEVYPGLLESKPESFKLEFLE